MVDFGRPMKEQKEPPFDSDGWYWVAVSSELYEYMKKGWSPAVQVRIDGEAKDVLSLEFREVDLH